MILRPHHIIHSLLQIFYSFCLSNGVKVSSLVNLTQVEELIVCLCRERFIQINWKEVFASNGTVNLKRWFNFKVTGKFPLKKKQQWLNTQQREYIPQSFPRWYTLHWVVNRTVKSRLVRSIDKYEWIPSFECLSLSMREIKTRHDCEVNVLKFEVWWKHWVYTINLLLVSKSLKLENIVT